MCISYEFRRYIPLVTAYAYLTLRTWVDSSDSTLCRSVSGLFHRNKAEEWCKSKFCTIRTPINIIFLFSDPSSIRSTAIHAWSSHHHWQFDQFACSKAVLRFLVYGSDSSVRLNRVFDIFISWLSSLSALTLWQCDKTLTVALDVCKALIPAID